MLDYLAYKKRQKRMSLYPSIGFSGNSSTRPESIVEQMYHMENGSVYKGEKFSKKKVAQILEECEDSFNTEIKVDDAYLALNAFYHDLKDLFKHWFGSEADNKIIEAALVFWFGDDDKPGHEKIQKYFY